MMEQFRIPHRPGTPRWLTDAAVAAVVTGASLGASYAGGSWRHPGPDLAGYLLVAAGGASLAARRRYPVAVLAVTLAAALAATSLGRSGGGWFPLIVAFFTAVQARRRAAAVASLVIGYLVSVWPPWLIGTKGRSATFALALLCGLLALLTASELLRAAAARRLAAARIRQQELLRQAGEERMRIARDLHDVVAHNISVINVQANTALHLMDRQPERARQALTTINDVSRQALAELRSVLGVLRGADDGAPRAPAPGLGRLDALAGTMAAAGLKVEVETEGSPVRLPASVDLAAYRIIQEALTNSARHSGGTRATVRVRRRGGEVEVQVDDEGGTKPPGPAGTGSGIAGMTERARALGGWLRAGPRPGGGFRVTARLPVGRSEP
ncbi:MAG TPA: sensor histidine kinase [Streptosporangiaceae bacterium]|nr:sensor histidine kinase [Streptosporangiaceae bacterium]